MCAGRVEKLARIDLCTPFQTSVRLAYERRKVDNTTRSLSPTCL